MLEQLRQNSRSFLIWILFGIIIAAFVFTFGTQSDVSFSCTGPSADYAMTVDDEEVGIPALRYGLNTIGRSGQSKAQRAQFALDGLLKREILAQASAEAGFHVSNEMAQIAIREGDIYVLTMPVDGKSLYFDSGYFDDERLKAWVNGMGLSSLGQFIEEQQRELEAQNMLELIRSAAVSTPEEARARFIYENTKATLAVVQFRPGDYIRKIVLTPADTQKYLDDNRAEVQAKYDADAALYKGRGKEVQIRQIFFARQKPAVLRPGQEASEPAAGEEEDPALVAARQARERIVGGADFAAVASELSEDERTKAKGGYLGWRSQENPGLGARELADGIKELGAGEVSEVISVPRGFYVFKIEGVREGDLSFDQVALELAEQMAVESYAKLAAQRDAEEALAKAKAVSTGEGSAIEQLYPMQQQQQQQQMNLQDLPPEILEQLNRRGSLDVLGPDRPAEATWQGGAQPAVPGDQPRATTTRAAAPGAVQATATAQATATGDAEAGPAPALSTIEVPVPRDLVTPQARSVGPLPRDPDGMIMGVGKSEELMKAIFTSMEPGKVADQVYEVSDTFAVVELKKLDEPDLESFEKDARMRTQILASQRGIIELNSWLQSRCEALVAEQKIRLNLEFLNQVATDNEGDEFSYSPNCASM